MRTIAIRSGPIAVAKATVALLWRRITFLRAISACSLAVLSCSAPNNGTTGEETASPQEPISWEDFKHAATRHYKGREIYIVEWDLPVTEDQLRERYDAYVRGVRNANGGVESVSQASSVERVNGVDDVWHGYQMWLTYCVSNTFGADKARVVSEMQNATAAWESVARVRFFYEPDQDELCDSDDNNFNDFFFAVRPWAEDGSAAFFPSQKASGIPGIIHIDLQSYPSNAFWFYRPNVTTEGALRHELGHVLGLEHEHDRCASGYTGRDLTAYDSGSVMHYPGYCGAGYATTYAITPSDAVGVRRLYGAPGPEAIWWHNGLTGETKRTLVAPDLTVVGSEQVSPTLNVLDSSGWKPFGRGDFNKDGYLDIFWHNGTTGASLSANVT